MHPSVSIEEPKLRELPSPRSQDKVPTYFHQECPACGRPLRLPIEQFGQQLICRHCGSRLNTADSLTGERDTPSAIARADQLLAECSSDNTALRQRILSFLRTRGIDGLESISVEVHQGIVLLRGRIASPHIRWLCTNCTRRVAGVIRVIDELEIENKGASSKRRPR